MNKILTTQEAEAVIMLKDSNEAAFNTLISYFDRRYNLASKKCVGARVEVVQIDQGMARAFDEIRDIEESANDVYNTEKQR